MNSSNDHELLLLMRRDNSSAFEKLFIKYHKRVYAFALKLLTSPLDAEEVVQNVFMSVWNQRKQIKITNTFTSYLFGITRHVIYDSIQQKNRYEAFIEYYLQHNQDYAFITDDEVHFRELKEKLNILIEKLPERRKEIFLLNRDSGLTYKEISTKLNITENTVDTQIRNALNFLRDHLMAYKNL